MQHHHHNHIRDHHHNNHQQQQQLQQEQQQQYYHTRTTSAAHHTLNQGLDFGRPPSPASISVVSESYLSLPDTDYDIPNDALQMNTARDSLYRSASFNHQSPVNRGANPIYMGAQYYQTPLQRNYGSVASHNPSFSSMQTLAYASSTRVVHLPAPPPPPPLNIPDENHPKKTSSVWMKMAEHKSSSMVTQMTPSTAENVFYSPSSPVPPTLPPYPSSVIASPQAAPTAELYRRPSSSLFSHDRGRIPSIPHSDEDPIPFLIANRTVTELIILLGPRGNRAASLQSQLEAQQPPAQFPTLRLVAAASNRYAGVGEYWSAAMAHVVIEGNVPLTKSVKRLKNAAARATTVRDHVHKTSDISLAMMGLMTSTCEDLNMSTDEMAVDFQGEGPIAAILATSASWKYIGSDGVVATAPDFEPIWEKQFAVTQIVAQVRLELVEPVTDYVTPFASALCARTRAGDGDPYAAMMTVLTYEARRGGPKVAHWIALRDWGVGVATLNAGDLLDPGWVTAECTLRGGLQGDTSGLSASLERMNLSADKALAFQQTQKLNLSLLPNTLGTMSWSPFCKIVPSLTLTKSPYSSSSSAAYTPTTSSSDDRSNLGVQLNLGEYHVLRDIQATGQVITTMDALMKVISTVGSTAAMAACGYPHMPDGISGGAVRDMTAFVTKRSRVAFSALGGIMLARGKKEAIRALLSCVSLAARMGDGWEQREMMVRQCGNNGEAFLLYSREYGEEINPERGASWLCLPGGKVRMVLICSGDQGKVRCLGTATFVGNIPYAANGRGVFVC